ncbi:hypothetical protein LHU53_04695 [Rhodoferax sp. U2-2l]|uniref:hypothetical protein n=1 Tax=Rhodoferax sp. U2-2l TaxID=2884000 RepID=UPI001D0B787A|nr:hypothetical protein [Rhodoferax sp. U2-2l]MCB8746200.1 hypothetical protein [Rhodoferax sp. U2-2l]
MKLRPCTCVWVLLGALAGLASPLAAAEPPSLEIIDAKHITGIQRVAVASFVVQYVVAQEATSKGGASSGIDFTAQL